MKQPYNQFMYPGVFSVQPENANTPVEFYKQDDNSYRTMNFSMVPDEYFATLKEAVNKYFVTHSLTFDLVEQLPNEKVLRIPKEKVVASDGFLLDLVRYKPPGFHILPDETIPPLKEKSSQPITQPELAITEVNTLGSVLPLKLHPHWRNMLEFKRAEVLIDYKPQIVYLYNPIGIRNSFPPHKHADTLKEQVDAFFQMREVKAKLKKYEIKPARYAIYYTTEEAEEIHQYFQNNEEDRKTYQKDTENEKLSLLKKVQSYPTQVSKPVNAQLPKQRLPNLDDLNRKYPLKKPATRRASKPFPPPFFLEAPIKASEYTQQQTEHPQKKHKMD